MVDYGLKDRVAIITGANNPWGIGATTALAFAREVAKYGITVNCVAPGPTQTGWIDDEEVALKICSELTKKFTDDQAYLDKEIKNFFRNVQCIELVPEHMTGKLVNEWYFANGK